MADKNKKGNPKNEELYQWISNDLQDVKSVLASELKVSAAQIASMYEGVKAANATAAGAIAQEIRYSYKQNQNIYEGISSVVKTDVADRLNAMDEKMVSLEKLEAILNEISDLKYNYMQLQALCEGMSSVVSDEVAPKLGSLTEKSASLETIEAALQEVIAKLADGEALSEEEVKKVVEESLSVHSQQILDAVAAVPVAENVDYTRITEEVSDKVAELLEEKTSAVDYEKVAGDTAAKVVESLPYVEPVDYNRINDAIVAAVAAAVNVDAIAEAVAAKLVVPAPVVEAPEIDYDKLADLVVEKLTAKGISADVVLDEEGIDKIAETVAEKISSMTLVCEYEEVIGEPAVEEATEETVEEPVEEVVETVEAEEVAEEPVEEAVEEYAATSAEPVYEEGLDGELIDAETGLVVRLKRSFTAKMKQSDEKVKVYYSDLKNGLTSYKKINSNVSWHGDRFNFGRDTVAKVGINGKTLCFYLALDPNDPELKQTVYHQKDVGAQKAYESTPFMVKVKSDAALKKALRLVAILADKIGTEPDEKFEEVDYVLEYAYESTKSLFESGYIKATKEKKVDFNF